MRQPADDRGVFAVVYALLAVLLFLAGALVVDIGGLQLDRRMERSSTDSAATAGAAFLNPSDPNSPSDACRNAFEYVALDLQDEGTMTHGACSVLNGTCVDGSTASRVVTGTAGRYTVTVTYPVPDNSPLMIPNVAPNDGSPAALQTVNSSYDGHPCQRLAVSVTSTRRLGLASAANIRTGSTSVTSVARTDILGSQQVVAPLVVLDQTHCNTLVTSGQGDIRVVNNGVYPGIIAVDSDGTKDLNPLRCDSPNQYVIDSQGTNNGRIVAYPGSGGADSAIYSYALLGSRADRAFDAGDIVSNCDPTSTVVGISGKVCPKPTALGERVTRKPWDDRYGAYIATLRSRYAASDSSTTPVYTPLTGGAWQVISSNTACGNGGQPDKLYPAGNYFFNCDFTARANIAFAAGSTVVFEGNVTVQSGGGAPGCLAFNTVDTTPVAACADASPAPTSDMVVYMRQGTTSGSDHGILAKGAQGSLVAPRTLIVQSGSDSTTDVGRFDLGAGSGRIYWTPPQDGGPGQAGLTYWSEGRSYPHDGDPSSPTPHQLGGQANLTLQGVMFMPNAQVTFDGQGFLNQFDAQFVTYRLENKGSSALLLRPDPNNMVAIPIVGVHLIR
jgi:Flp pilus assembly protein TadG